jgi:hypothetical protein
MDFGNISKSAGDILGKVNFESIKLDDLKLDEILDDDFISKNTTLNSVKSFLEKSGFNISSIVDLKNLPIDKLDGFIKSISSFGSWKEMLEKAVKGKLGGLL